MLTAAVFQWTSFGGTGPTLMSSLTGFASRHALCDRGVPSAPRRREGTRLTSQLPAAIAVTERSTAGLAVWAVAVAEKASVRRA